MTADLKLGLAIGYSGATVEDNSDMALEAERLGYDSVWTAEAYGSDVFTPLAWIGAQDLEDQARDRDRADLGAHAGGAGDDGRDARPRCRADGVILGLGVSGPQVVEGWYGVPFPKPLARTREYVEIVQKILRREGPVTNDGEHYPLPYPGGAGLGKPLKLTVHPTRSRIPIWLAAEGPKNVALSTQIADGLAADVLLAVPRRGVRRRAGRRAGGLRGRVRRHGQHRRHRRRGADARRSASCRSTSAGWARRTRTSTSTSSSAWASRTRHSKVQELFMSGRREEAVKAVPDELADEISLCGPPGRIKERLEAWVKSPVTQLIVGFARPEGDEADGRLDAVGRPSAASRAAYPASG